MVRLVGRTGRGRGTRSPTPEEVATISGLTVSKVLELELKTDWTGVDLPTAEAFCRGCHFDPTARRDRNYKCGLYLQLCRKRNREPWWYLRSTEQWPKYQKMISALMSSQKPAEKSKAG